jgi:cobalt-precorrin 5A hydrolase / precorrin-3B C17-methyltransferase
LKPAIFILGQSALPLAQKLKAVVDGEIWGPKDLQGADYAYEKATDGIAAAFVAGKVIFGICATGILIRAVGRHLRDKHHEPPVLAIAEDGSMIVPLLGGHHGGNFWARKIATALQGTAAITTASDVIFGQSFDEPEIGYSLGNPEHMKAATSAKLRGEVVDVIKTIHREQGSDHRIIMHPNVLAIGIGCERGTDPSEVQALIKSTLLEHNLSHRSVAVYASIDLKEDEPALSQLFDVTYFTAEELSRQSDRIATPSVYVAETVGTPSVAEAAALVAAGEGATLIVTKTKSKRATIAIAKAPAPISLNPPGRRRGQVSVVGVGPGTRLMRSPQVTFELAMATDWVGYDLYLDLSADIKTSQIEHRFPLGGEEARCRHAIELAKQGKYVALVCSGDAGIYAMAALVYELIDREPCRVAVEVHPGISAFQMASAKAGAMIGHDFCCISLSDLLTPWETIVQRVKAAAEGDFVISFYNPRSLKRTDQIVKVFEILKPHRSPDTPVVLATNLGRPEEHVRILTFSEFNPQDVDMLTLVMVGSSQSKSFKRGDGKTYAYTPRGYAKKMDPL